MDSLFFFAALTLPVMRKEDFNMKTFSHVLSNEKLRAVGRFLKMLLLACVKELNNVYGNRLV